MSTVKSQNLILIKNTAFFRIFTTGFRTLQTILLSFYYLFELYQLLEFLQMFLIYPEIIKNYKKKKKKKEPKKRIIEDIKSLVHLNLVRCCRRGERRTIWENS